MGTAIPTIGYGHTHGVKMGDVCTEEQAEAWLSEDMEASATIVGNYFPNVTQNEFDALCDFCYNVGPGLRGVKDGLIWLKSGEHSTLMKLVLEGDMAAAADEFPKWNLSGGKVLPGLVVRRAAERQLFLGLPEVTT